MFTELATGRTVPPGEGFARIKRHNTALDHADASDYCDALDYAMSTDDAERYQELAEFLDVEGAGLELRP